MSFSLELTRPDDLLNLTIEGDNLRLDVSEPGQPVLVVDHGNRPAFLRVIFPPQSIAESAVFEASLVQPESNPSDPPDPDTAKTINEPDPLPKPGTVKARMAHSSRLVFKVPPDARIPFSIEGILDWSALELSVHPIAAIPPDPTAAQIAGAPAISAPTQTETALELPYKLIVSPSDRVRWAHRRQPFTARGRTELWHTRLQLVPPPADDEAPSPSIELSRVDPAPLRALWSPDFNPNAPPDPQANDLDLGRAAMSPSDRHQLVILTSAFHGYEVERESTYGLPIGGGHIGGPWILPPLLKLTLPHVPQPFFAEQLMLSPLGGWLKSRGHWTPPHTARPAFHFPGLIDFDDLIAAPQMVDRPLLAGLLTPFRPAAVELLQREPVEDKLDLSEWVHVATQGRDHYVRIVYEGELWPFRNRAALVKITERKFKEQDGLVVAHLFQRMFIVVREPEKRFSRTDRGMPFKKVRLTTLVTPNIAEPKVTEPSFAADTKRSFWVEVLAPGRTFFKFHAVGTDVGGNDVDFTIPLMFVSIAETEETRKKAAIAYNALDTSPRRSAVVPGQKLLFAERAAAAPNDNTELATRAVNFVMDATGSAPTMLKADVNIPQVQELLGSDAPTTIRYYESYIDQGFDAATGVFAEVVKEDPTKFQPTDPFASLVAETLGVTFQSDQAGGIATPNLGVSTLSRALGPLAGKATDAITDTFDPKTFFKKGAAQLFGTFDLIDLLLPATMGTNAPKLRTESQNIPGGKLLVATLDWEPQVKDVAVPPAAPIPIASFKKDHGGTTKLVVHGRIEKPLTIDSLGAPVAADVKSAFTGTLNDFRVGVLGAVFINFKTFGFESRTNAKPDVKVALDPALPMEFAGDLKFVEELRKAIPPNLFGKGPSLDLITSPLGIRAGFAFALPPVAVGVFALKDVSLGAALTLPFLDGKPTFDFNVSERARPFLLAVSIFGGGGFFHLQLDTAGLKLVEAAFEFGATASIDLGVASGGVHIMAGIYFKLERKEPTNDLAPTLSGYLRLGGYLSVLGLIKVSLEFNLSFTYDGAKDKAYGRATLTVKVEIVFFSTSVEVTVEKAFGGSSGDPKFGQMFPAPSVWSEYALAFA